MITLRVVDLILKKKEGLVLTKAEIDFLINGYVQGIVPDYQISALLMAICFQGLNNEEQIHLTNSMLESGEKIDLSSIEGICVDKHSTGGVGDKTTLVLAPIIASLGLKMAKMSGRGLGHTGGTLDKLEAIPGFKISLTSEEFFKQVQEISLAVVGQTANIAPADKMLYALRDVTGTVESIGLIASSIMSKKLASGASHILLDVKVGDGAFMKDLEAAKALAKAMVDIGNKSGRKTVALLTDMDQPLGSAVGNALEVIEAIDTLKGKGPKDLTDLCCEIAAELLLMTNMETDKAKALKRVDEVITNGQALESLKSMIRYQGGDEGVVDDYSLFATAKHKIPVLSKEDGYLQKVEALNIGKAAMILGAGRQKKEDLIDQAVGVYVNAKVGAKVKVGDVLAYVYANDINQEEAVSIVSKAFRIVEEKVQINKIVLDKVD